MIAWLLAIGQAQIAISRDIYLGPTPNDLSANFGAESIAVWGSGHLRVWSTDYSRQTLRFQSHSVLPQLHHLASLSSNT